MKSDRFNLRLLVAVLGIVSLLPPICAAAPLTSDEAVAIATEAYIYGYSLITTEVTRIQMSNVSVEQGM
jgi:hypothetical protein